MKLSDFQDEKAIEVIARLLEPIGNIAADARNRQAKDQSIAAFAGALLQNNPRDVMTMLAVLSDQNPADYHCTAASVLVDLLTLLNDPPLMQLFGLQSKSAGTSGSASERTEAPAQ